ncbi:MAG: hypothetical protein AABY84_08930 [Candidatus Firestonebacteria bacterium]
MKKRLTLHEKAFLALKEAVREVVENHKKTGRPLAIWKNGKVVWVTAK